MHGHLLTAMDALKKLSGREMRAAETWVREIVSLKYELEAVAELKGYSRACRNAIPACRGECCRWHFPVNLTRLDFFVAIFHMSEARQAALAKQIIGNRRHRCPMLLETGCFLSFEERPVPCTNAYPCFHQESYWREKEKRNVLFKRAFDALDAVVSAGAG